MLNKLRLPTLAVAAALTLFSPAAAMARDRDDRGRDHERREFRNDRHEDRERGRRFLNRDYWYGATPRVYVAPYANGYYDQWGYWHPYASGYHDRWGHWHPYGY